MGKKGGGIGGIFKGLFNLGKLFKGGGGAGWLFAIILITSLFKKKKKAPEAVVAATNYESPTYSFGGGVATSIATDNAPIPLVFGHHMVGGNIVNSFLSSNNSTMDEVEVGIAPGNISHVSHCTNDNCWSVYKITSCPTATVINVLLGIPYAMYNGTYADLLKNTAIEIYHASATGYSNPALRTLGAKTAVSVLATRGGNTVNSVTYFPISLVVNNTSVNDIYIFVQVTNFTTTGLPLSLKQRQEINYMKYVGDYLKIAAASYNTSYSTIAAGGASNQKLLMDVVLSAGEIRNLKTVYLNDKLLYESKLDNKQGGVQHSAKYRFRPGFDAFSDLNAEGTLQSQSTVYNQSDVAIDKLVGSTMSQDGIPGDTKVYLNDTSMFSVGMKLAAVEARTPQWGSYTVTDVQDDYITISVAWGSGAWKAGTPLYIYTTETPTYTDFQYTTQGESIDGIVIGLNAPEGLYNTNTSTGAIYNRSVTVRTIICPATLASGTATSFPLTDIPSSNYLVNQETTLTGSKRNRLWFDLNFNKQLTTNTLTGEKKYLVEIRKTTDNTISEYARNTLQVAYVEEYVNKELVYPGCSYVGMSIEASSKVNSGTPDLKFEIDGLLVPQALHDSIKINTTSSTVNTIYTEFNTSFASSTNYTDLALDGSSTTSYALSGFLVYHNYKTYTLMDDQAIHYVGASSSYFSSCFVNTYNHYLSPTIGTEGYSFYYGIYKAYFKCGDSWYRRYVTIQQERLADAPLPPTSPAHYRNVIYIINESQYLDSGMIPYLYNKYVDAEWLKEINTDLPSVPTDMLIYQWSDNPVWITLFLLCDENHGAGIPFENIDFDSFIEAAAYYEDYVDNPITSVADDVIKRCRINYVIDSYSDLRSHLEKILTICHGALYNSNDKIKFLVERALEDSEFIVSLDEDEDLLDLSVTSVPTKELPNQLVVTYLDENDKYGKKSITVEDSSLSKSVGYQAVVKQDIDMYGLTNESHVLMEAMRIIKAGRYVRFGIQLKTSLSGLPIEVYDGFKLTSTTFGWTNKKFRCVAIRYNENLECEIDAVEYYDEIYELSDDDLIKYHEVQHTELPNLTEAPEKVQDLVVFEEDVRNNDGSISVHMVGHFNPDQTITFNTSGTEVVSNTRYAFNKTDYALVTLYRSTTGSASTYNTVREKIRFDGNEFRFNNLDIGAYYYAVVEPASRANAIGPPTSSSAILLSGKAIPPIDITSATWTQLGSDHSQFYLQWAANTTDFDLASYVVRFATATGDWDSYEYEEIIPFPKTSAWYTFHPTGINNYGGSFGAETDTNFQIIIKCLDSSGNYSPDGYILFASATLEPPDVTDLTIAYVNNDNDYPFNITWTKPITDSIYRYQVKVGSSTSDWSNAQYSFLTHNPWLYLDHADLSGTLYGSSTLKIMVKAINTYLRMSSGASTTASLTLAPTTVASGTLELGSDGTLWAVMPAAPTNKDFLQYYGRIATSSDPATGVVWAFVSTAGHQNKTLKIPANLDGVTFYLHYRAVDKYGYYGNWDSDFSTTIDVIPAAVSSTQMKYKVTNNGISLLLPDKSQELSWDYYDVHISSASGFTPDVTASSPTRVAVGKTNKFEINQFNDGTPLESAATYYIKVRSLSKYAPTTETYHSAFNTSDLVVTTADATAPIIIVDAITPSIAPINIIIGDTLQVNYTVSDNGTIDRTRGRVYHVDHLASATWIDPITSSTYTFDLFPSSTDGNYILQLQVFDSQGNYSSYTNYFSRDTAIASAPTTVTAEQINTTGIQVSIGAPTGTINIKEYVVEYAVDTGSGYSDWAEIRRTNATTFVESLAVAGTVKFRVKTTKIHSATLDSDYTESTPITMDSVGPSLQIDYTTPDIFLDTLLTSNDVIFHFLTSDTIGLQAIDPVKYSLDSSVYTTATTTVLNASGTAASGTIELTDLSDGSHYITFRSYDEVGNTKDTMTYYFEIDTAVPADLDTPTIAVNGRTITITIPDFTPDANFKNIEYQIYNADSDAVIATFNK